MEALQGKHHALQWYQVPTPVLIQCGFSCVLDSSTENLMEDEKGVKKRSFVDDSPLPSKQRKLSLVDVYTSIKSAFSKIDATVNAVKTTWAKIDTDDAKQTLDK